MTSSQLTGNSLVLGHMSWNTVGFMDLTSTLLWWANKISDCILILSLTTWDFLKISQSTTRLNINMTLMLTELFHAKIGSLKMVIPRFLCAECPRCMNFTAYGGPVAIIRRDSTLALLLVTCPHCGQKSFQLLSD